MNYLKNIPRSISKLHYDIFPTVAKGSYIYTTDTKYLDLTSGIGALSTGHNHPLVVKKVEKQLRKYVHMPQQIFQSHPAQVELTEKLLKTMPSTRLDNVFYVSSGSEATDNAIKIARVYTGKSNIIAMNRGFHGRTIAALSITSSNTVCKNGISPLLPNIFFCHDFTKDAIDNVLNFQSDPTDTAAIIIEPVQGEGGIFSVGKEFMSYIENICKRNNILLIADEVQCGSMRTGHWWNIEKKDVQPDLITFGKGIASGYPLAGVIGTSDVMNTLNKGTLGGTYGGNAICSAAASASIDILNEPEIKENVQTMGKYIKHELIQEEGISNIRQYGLMIGIELDPQYNTKKIVEELKKRGILVLVAGNKGQYIRLLPPLNIDKEDVDMFIDVFKDIL